MQAKIRSPFILTVILALSLATSLPARADEDVPPDLEDIITLQRVLEVKYYIP